MKRTFLISGLVIAIRALSNTKEPALKSVPLSKGFHNGTSGYLYNVGAQAYLVTSANPKDQFMWIKGVKDVAKATPLTIERDVFRGLTYNIIRLSEVRTALGAPPKQLSIRMTHSPFFGHQVLGRVGEDTNRYVGLLTDPSNPVTWVVFSPPVHKTTNAFKIYLGNMCLALQNNAYLRVEKCVLAPDSKRNNQLFIWYPQEEHNTSTNATSNNGSNGSAIGS
ncbi:hypothetical protein NEHOM01_2296 [Nematocida homosporus]|uniref:uncharacterized protein n=1 Tax=Nematocida homosporus TaxID=1912981 RepID=UPI00221FCD4B|nr:uncharacterized protein NEHOM01_2296 [Nematocida homosporus]KAI5187592.1 hypothetical protein NEHOM01_2296 [Nematocida homosporus]